MGTDAGARADYLVAVSQINNRMELLGQYEAHRVWFKYRNSAAGKQAIADDAAGKYQNGQDIYPDQAAKDTRYDFLRDRFKHDVKSVYEGTALRKFADVGVADPNGASADPLRADAVPFASADLRLAADKEFYDLILEVFKHADLQLLWQQQRGIVGRGATCMAELARRFDPRDLASAIVAVMDFLTANYSSSTLAEHCTKMNRQFQQLRAMYFSQDSSAVDWESFAMELCATAFVRSLPSDKQAQVRADMNLRPRSDYTFANCMASALESKLKGHAYDGTSTEMSAFVFYDHPEMFTAFLSGTKGVEPGVICTNCGELNTHSRGKCPKPCRIPLPGGRRGDCNGVAPAHNVLCMMHPTNVQLGTQECSSTTAHVAES
jgi:hypothetical protein